MTEVGGPPPNPDADVFGVGDEDLDSLPWNQSSSTTIKTPRPNGAAQYRVLELPEVKHGVDLFRVVDELGSALGKADPMLFCRGYELVTVVGAATGDAEKTRAPVAKGAPIVRPLDSSALNDRCTRFVRYLKYDDDQRDWVLAQPSPVVRSALLVRGEWADVRPLVSVTETPVLRPDGTVHQSRGYDPETGYLFLPSCSYPAVPEKPDQAAAESALAELVHVFADFPYIAPSHRMVAIAALLTILARPAIDGPTPAFLFEAPTPGTGKTLQCDVLSVIATGRLAPRQTYPEDDDELDKALSSYALAGARVVLLDNVTRPFGGGPLDKVITATDVGFRLLGRTEIRELPWRAVILASGNNLSMTDDGAARRVLRSRIESPLETPEDRTEFTHPNLLEWVFEQRPRLVSAALTVLRAFRAAGSPGPAVTWGSFEAWSRLIPRAILFAGGADVLECRVKGADAVGDELGAVVVFLHDLPRLAETLGRESLATKEILGAIYPAPHADDAPDGWDDLRLAIETIAPARVGPPQAKALGQKLSRYVGRPLGSKKLTGAWDEKRVRRWRVDPAR